MASNNAKNYKAAHDAFNSRDWNTLQSFFAPKATYDDHPTGLTTKTAEEFVDWTKGWVKAFSDCTVAEPRYIDAGDTVVALFTGRGTNDGPMMDHPATGQRIAVPMCEVLKFDSSGKIVHGEIFYDAMTMLTQLGLAQPPK